MSVEYEAKESKEGEQKTVLDFWPGLKKALTKRGRRFWISEVEKQIKAVGGRPVCLFCYSDMEGLLIWEKRDLERRLKDWRKRHRQLYPAHQIVGNIPLDESHSIQLLLPVFNQVLANLEPRAFQIEEPEIPAIDQNGQTCLLPKSVLKNGIGTHYTLSGNRQAWVCGLTEDLKYIRLRTKPGTLPM